MFFDEYLILFNGNQQRGRRIFPSCSQTVTVITDHPLKVSAISRHKAPEIWGVQSQRRGNAGLTAHVVFKRALKAQNK